MLFSILLAPAAWKDRNLIDFSSRDHEFAPALLFKDAAAQKARLTMTQTLMIVTYNLTTAPDAFRADAMSFAPQIADAPGLEWKIWGLDANRAGGASVYLFNNPETAQAFASGSILAALRSRPDVAGVTTAIFPVDRELSVATGAFRALGSPLMPTMDVQKGTQLC